jgi:hypothetical protein
VATAVQRRVVAGLAALLALALVAGAVVAVLHWIGRIELPGSPPAAACDLAGSTYTVDPEQAGNAATVAGVALDRGLPERAVTIALATSLQESKLRNLEYGDRDSLGLFQQRPSQGWGTPAQILDPVYSAGKFYDALVKVSDWQTRPLTEVAQRVQQSGFPEAYAQWEQQAGALSHVLVARVPAGLSCRFEPDEAAAEQPRTAGLTPRAAAVLAAAAAELGSKRLAAPAGSTDPAYKQGRGLDLGPAGWFTANWLVGHAEIMSIRLVGFDGQLWTPDRGWHAPDPADAAQAVKTRITVRVA